MLSELLNNTTNEDRLMNATMMPTVNKVTKTINQTYYAWYAEARGEWVRSDNDRTPMWEKNGIKFVKVSHCWESYKLSLNDKGERDEITVTVEGMHAHQYINETLPACRLISVTTIDSSTIIVAQFTF